MTPKPSRLGMGTYLGALTPEFSEKVKMTLAKGIQELGLTTIDTAINYRCMRSEQLIGDLIQTKKINRDRIYLTTKGGFIPFDQNIPENSTPYIHNKITTPLNLEPADIIEGCHCIHPTYIEWSLNQSLLNLKTQSLDIYFIHNPEFALGFYSREAWEEKLITTLHYLETQAVKGVIKNYGLATWQGLRVAPNHPQYISLQRILDLCRDKFTPDHFKAIQTPINPYFREFLQLGNQFKKSTVQAWCAENDFTVLSSAPLLQGQLIEQAKEVLDAHEWNPNFSAVDNLLSWTLRVKYIQSTLIGTHDFDHLKIANSNVPLDMG